MSAIFGTLRQSGLIGGSSNGVGIYFPHFSLIFFSFSISSRQSSADDCLPWISVALDVLSGGKIWQLRPPDSDFDSLLNELLMKNRPAVVEFSIVSGG
jgi:hypothetical protein